MKATLLKKISFLSWLLVWIVIFINVQAFGQIKGKPKPGGQQCDGNGFSTEVVKAETNENGCIEYELKISHDNTVRYDLSHFAVDLPCGTITALSNSENWDQVIGKDPTTGLTGFKIDNIPSFGKGSNLSFTVKVTICGGSTCDGKLGVVAYKAGTCVDYDTLNYEITNPNGGGGNNGGGGSTGGGGTSGDSTKTCSTLLASLVKRNITCYGNTDGQIIINTQSGKAPFTYQWSTGSTDSALYNISAGTYSVTIKDADGNTLTLTEQITQPDDISITSVVANPGCIGLASGSIDISVTGGSGSFNYSWSNGATTQDLTNLASGFYKLIVMDSNSGCLKNAYFVLSNTTTINLSSAIKNPDCGQPTGGINLSVSGGTAPYTFSWSNGATTEDLINVAAGAYSVTVTDANGCKTNASYNVKANSAIQVSYKVTQTNCANDSIGAIDLTVTAGTAPFTYSWQHGPTTEDVSGLVAGTYWVTVTNATGCTLRTAINVSRKTIQLTSKIVQPSCSGDSTGSILITPVESGTYTYQWSNGDTTNPLTGLSAGKYTVTITNEFGCSVMLAYTLTQPAPIQINASTGNSQCGTEGNFSINLAVSGGSLPYTYAWSTGATTQDLTSINSGAYTVTVTDVNHCSAAKEISIDANPSNWACSIMAPSTIPTCGSVGNTLSSAVADANTYSWTVSSSDNSWIITSGGASSKVVYTAGAAGGSATFTLTTEKSGCVKTCTYTISNGCTVRDNDGGGDPSKGDPCSSTPISPVTDGNITPTPIPTDTTNTEDPHHGLSISGYPNPFDHDFNIEVKHDRDDYVKIDMLDCQGNVVKTIFKGNVHKGETHQFNYESSEMPKGIYFCRYGSTTQSKYMKVLKK
ncbi:MAG TPA: T9SS type A sorting domain-containing protein [Cyclobacteriaceae bacterium]